jgi:hypothetical protein|tara:strand:+ start:9657 stop:9971 length:315 start_codon:yes stop_codon:yes gene_type:complete
VLDSSSVIDYITNSHKEDIMATSTEEKKRYVLEYLRSLNAIEEAMEPFKEQKRELRTEFREQGWLNTDEIRAAVKAFRLFKGKVNIDEVYDNYKMLSGESVEEA